MIERRRCDWADKGDALMTKYHDEEWGVPLRDDREWYAKLTLDGAQAGLSWRTILYRREGYREAFHDFDVARVASMTARDVERLMKFEGIIRNRQKIESAIENARAFQTLQAELGSFDRYIWSAVGGKPLQPSRMPPWPATTPLSDAISKDLKKRGFSFVGSTIVYAFMQAAGVINDHRDDCFRKKPIATLGRRFKP
ncbi:MAG TPA: DNA-3-methyladenine glycosylase I [Polyangiales bacterium]|nr:DNA-3-methyladenine glycosylase I [Polyangiales bacterium]